MAGRRTRALARHALSRHTLSRRTLLVGLSAGVGAAAGWALTSSLDREDDPGSAAGPDQGTQPDGPRPYVPPEGAVRVLEPRRFFYDDPGDTDGQTFGDLFLPDSANPSLPVVVLIHGGGWRDATGPAYMENQARDLASFDVAVWNVEYRRVHSGGGWPTTVADVCGAVDHLVEVSAQVGGRLDLRRVVVTGHSAGGHLALWVAGRARLPSSLPGARRRPVRGRPAGGPPGHPPAALPGRLARVTSAHRRPGGLRPRAGRHRGATSPASCGTTPARPSSRWPAGTPTPPAEAG